MSSGDWGEGKKKHVGECVGEAKYVNFAVNSKHKIEDNIIIGTETR